MDSNCLDSSFDPNGWENCPMKLSQSITPHGVQHCCLYVHCLKHVCIVCVTVGYR